MSKALLIQSYTELTTGTQGQWNQLNMANSYIQGIQTGDILGNVNAATLNALISGVPTPWARAKLFKYALDTLNNPNPNINNGGLVNFYEILHGEWKGLLATIALYPDRIRFSKPVIMNTKGADYDIASTFGRMLFEDKDVWCNQEALAKNPDEQPFIQLIYYRNQLVGGTSPMTGIFTGVNYTNLGDLASDIPWYRNGKFEDPTRYLTPEQLQKVYLFIKNINSNIADFEKSINSQRGKKPHILINGFKGMARLWESELQDLAQNNNQTLRQVGPIPKFSILQSPFSILFKSDVPVYLKKDYTFTYINDRESELIGDIQELLSDDEYVIGWVEPQSQRPKLDQSPVYFLRYKDIQSEDTYYFSVPLSEKGIDIFKNKLSTILGYAGNSNTKLSAHITDAGLLSVSLIVEIDGEKVTLNDREYNINWLQNQGRVIAWPNFVSEKWNKYYLFSEYTDEAQEQFIPIFKSKGEILKTIDGNFLTSQYIPSPDEVKQVDIKRLVTYPAGIGDEMPKYNIISANKPFFGLKASVKVAGRPNGAGYLIMRSDIIKDLSTVDLVSEAVIGVDFGSNNTCLFYNNGHGVRPIEFGNYRAVLVGRENNDLRAIADNNELLFFTNYPSNNGQLKSWLHEHDNRYVGPNASEEVAGGVPVNRPNVRVVSMNEYEIKTQAGTLHYNMKWLDDEKGREKKRAFLKSIWLQACAFLYTNRIRPEEIYWSFPGSMMEADRNDLERIYEDLCKITPYGRKPELSNKTITEAEAVCSFALSQEDLGLSGNNIFLGIDVGGSTSDILLIAKNPHNGNHPALFRESSVRLAAGVFFDAVIKSEQFRQALVNFHEGHNTDVHVENISEILTFPEKAPYYLNSIFDQLKTQEDYDAFYDSLSSNAKFVFTIPAYVSGLLLFYSGMLIGKTIKDFRLGNIEKVDLLPFGKGGRIFHWLRHATASRTTREFYETCVNAGIQLILPDKTVIVNYRQEIEVDNKTEVARGLCDMQSLDIITELNDTDICGETGVTFISKDGVPRNIAPDEEIGGEYFADDMCHLDFTGAQNFEKYMRIFIDFVSKRTGLYKKADETLWDDISDIPNLVGAFCTADEEYKKAQKANKNGDGFHYHQPIIIAEGARFLKSLIRKVFNQ